jgi:hypothetical protein
MVSKEIFLVKKDGAKLWAVQKANGALWQDGVEIFAAEAEAGKRGWKVDAVKVRWGAPGKTRGLNRGEGVRQPGWFFDRSCTLCADMGYRFREGS